MTPAHEGGTPANTAPANTASASTASASGATTGVLASAVRVVSGLTLLSRFAGLARDVIIARVLGDTALGSAFRSAYALPNLFRRLFGEGALSAAFLPEYARMSRDDPARAPALASLVIAALTLATGALTLIIEVILLALLLGSGQDEGRRTSFALMMLLIPMMPLVCTTAILGGMLQAHGRFAVSAAAPILLNLFQITAASLYWFGLLPSDRATAYAIALSALGASLAQVLWSLWALRGRVTWTRGFSAARTESRRVLSRFGPVVIGLGALQLSSMIDMVVAMWPTWVGPTIAGVEFPLDTRSYAILSFTQTIYQFPLGVFGIAVATAVFPLLSRHASDADRFVETLRQGLRLSFFIGLPATLGLVIVRQETVAVLFGGPGGFTADGIDRAADVLAGFAVAVWAYSLNHVLTRAFYARGDTTTPMRVALVMVAANLALNLVLIWPLREAGFAWSTACCATSQCLALALLLARRHGVHPFDAPTLRGMARVALAAGIMALGVLLTREGIGRLGLSGWRGDALLLAAGVGSGAILFAGLARGLRLPEARWLLQRPPKGAPGESVPMPME